MESFHFKGLDLNCLQIRNLKHLMFECLLPLTDLLRQQEQDIDRLRQKLALLEKERQYDTGSRMSRMEWRNGMSLHVAFALNVL